MKSDEGEEEDEGEYLVELERKEGFQASRGQEGSKSEHQNEGG